MDRVLNVENLSRVFGNFKAVDQISFEVFRGEIFGFLGANGAGKTTAIKILTGILEPSSGSANVAGCDIVKDRKKLKYKIGYMSQKFSLYQDLTLAENIDFFGGIYGLTRTQIKERRNEMLKRLGIIDLENKLVAEIPLGWRQKIAFSIAIIHEPEIVFLDEPTSGVDPHTRRQFWELIFQAAERGITAFVTTHYMDEAEYCDRISMMVEGKIAAYGPLDKLLAEHGVKNMDELFLKLAR